MTSKTSIIRMKRSNTSRRLTRRTFGKAVANTFGAALGFYFVPSRAWGNLEKPALAAIGTAGKGRSDISESDACGFQIAALVDVFDATKMANTSHRRLRGLGGTRQAYPQARFFTDYREMLDTMGDKIDAVTVSTPDHHHFHASALAMQAGKHVYCQKPLTHGIWEARMLRQLARQTNVKTQMGNQAHANDHLRRCVELIRAGVIGKVQSAHAWTNRPIWPQGFAEPPAKEPIPAGVDWQQWVGPAPWVDYSSKIAPFAWRGWWNYGTGALGDMACHIMDMPYWSVVPGAPISVIAEQRGATDISPPINSKITWEFAPNEYTTSDGFRFHWYDGYVNATFDPKSWTLVKQDNEYNHPVEEVLNGMNFQQFGSVVIGTAGKLFFHRGRNKKWTVLSSSDIDGFQWPTTTLPRATEQNNHVEWMDAINDKIDQSESNFQYAGQLTETILLGVLAQRVPDTRLQWDADKLAIQERPDLGQYIRREYRRGWEFKT